MNSALEKLLNRRQQVKEQSTDAEERSKNLDTQEKKALESFFNPPAAKKSIVSRKKGRPSVPDHQKAKNFTLCLAPKYLRFLDQMKVNQSKVTGRGRKIKFIIERFIEHEKRSLSHMKVLKSSLREIHLILKSIEVKNKNHQNEKAHDSRGKIHLSSRQKEAINHGVNNIFTLLNILDYSPQVLKKMLPREYMEVLSFCLNWKANKGVQF